MSALSYQLVTVTNCAAAVALCVATARDGCRSTNLRRPNRGRERNRSFHSRPAQRRSMLRWRMLATNVAQPISRPCSGSTTPLRAGEEQSGAAVSRTPARFTPCRPTRHQPGRQRRQRSDRSPTALPMGLRCARPRIRPRRYVLRAARTGAGCGCGVGGRSAHRKPVHAAKPLRTIIELTRRQGRHSSSLSLSW
jgi:hypothetical protein